MSSSKKQPGSAWHEVLDENGSPRPVYDELLKSLGQMPRSEKTRLSDRLEVVMREMGVTFDIDKDRPWGRKPWHCDLLPQILSGSEWELIETGFRQRLRAFELFLQDVYGERQILRDRVIPLQPVLGSPFYRHAAFGLRPPDDAFLHITGLSLVRALDGSFAVRHHYFSNASGISYMMQNRRALARVAPGLFEDYAVRSIADAPVYMLERLRTFSADPNPTVVLLSSGEASAVYSEHSFLARRMGIPVVQGDDLVVLSDRVFLKTVRGLEKVEVIYSRISEDWLDPLAFPSTSKRGVPGLAHCIRKQTVQVVNAVGSQLADDRALLAFAPAIIRYYLGEPPVLPAVATYWLGDIDQREVVLDDLERFAVRPLFGEQISSAGNEDETPGSVTERLRRDIMAAPSLYVAQPRETEAAGLCLEAGRLVRRAQDHIVFALRESGTDIEIFPGALTRIATASTPFTANELGGGSKDTWVLGEDKEYPSVPSVRITSDSGLLIQHTTSRVAEASYWIGRYLERARSLALMISVIEALETEELNETERRHYRPVWNQLLPPLENPSLGQRRSLASIPARYLLSLDRDEPGSVASTITKATNNAEAILEWLSLDAWGVLSKLRSRFQRVSLNEKLPDSQKSQIARRLCEVATHLIPQFFGVASATMVDDAAWRFCQIGQSFERATLTARAAHVIMRSLVKAKPQAAEEHTREIELSACLRLLNTRDAYRRVYQMRAEPIPVLEVLWNSTIVPQSVRRCLDACRSFLALEQMQASPALTETIEGISRALRNIQLTRWERFFRGAEILPSILDRIDSLEDDVLAVHNLLSDGFLNHQVHMQPPEQPLLPELTHAV